MIVRPKVDDHDAWCDVCVAVQVNISAASVYDVKRHIKSSKECKVYSIKIVKIFLGSNRIPNMVTDRPQHKLVKLVARSGQ